ncbi:MAG: hypothetical protein V2I82_08130, partial [Halieaceae bacterium]|jgi:hypothetical protein|nr:hypothetical protein [Halieaceae bacterium]
VWLVPRPAPELTASRPAAPRTVEAPDQILSAGSAAALSCTAGEADYAAGIEILGIDVVLPGKLGDELRSASTLVHERWREWLGDAALDLAPARLQFVSDAMTFHELYDGPNVDGSTATGFYRIRSHEAFILYSDDQRRRARSTALHELSHLVMAWHLGPTPAWLNEGLAEYFETLRIGPPPAYLRNPTHLELLLRDGPVALQTLLQLRRRDFGLENAQHRYASAWSLVAYLLEHRDGRTALTGLLRDAWSTRCDGRRSFSLEAIRSYPGGLEALERGWRQWIGRHSVHRPG